MLKRTIDLFEASGTTTRLSCHIPPGNYHVEGDAKLIGRIINNLIINGMQSVPEGRVPEIVIRMSVENGRVLIAVKDNGEGVPEGIRTKIFTPNFSTKTSGSGLGLAIAKRGIEHAGGRLWYRTKTGFGSIFYIELPLA
ncbi:MAG: ATP-binding protein [Cytophagales bacterium]|nr:ATP-binding protein [Cytophagales bacterium]